VEQMDRTLLHIYLLRHQSVWEQGSVFFGVRWVQRLPYFTVAPSQTWKYRPTPLHARFSPIIQSNI